MIIVVTGGAGFIGANLCRRLVEEPEVSEVRVVDDFSTGRRSNLEGLPVVLVEGSILDESLMRSAVDGCQAVIHLAAVPSVPRSIVEPRRSHDANATGTLIVLEAARLEGNPQVVLASSSAVYGANPTLPKSEDLRCLPMSPYAVAKLAAESYAFAYAQCYDMPVLPFRFFNVFGPLQAADHAYAAVVPAFLNAAIHGRPLPIHGDGQQSRDFTFVDSVTSVLIDSVLRKVTSDPVNLAFGTRTTILELVEMLEAALGHAVERLWLPQRSGDVRHSQADKRRLLDLFPNVMPTDLATGVQRTTDWFRTQARV